MRDTGTFLCYGHHRLKATERRVLVLHKSGKWNKLIEPRAGFHSMLRNVFACCSTARSKGVMDASLKFHLSLPGTPKPWARPCMPGKTTRAGGAAFFDIMEQDWKVPPAYSYIGPCLAAR